MPPDPKTFNFASNAPTVKSFCSDLTVVLGVRYMLMCIRIYFSFFFFHTTHTCPSVTCNIADWHRISRLIDMCLSVNSPIHARRPLRCIRAWHAENWLYFQFASSSRFTCFYPSQLYTNISNIWYVPYSQFRAKNILNGICCSCLYHQPQPLPSISWVRLFNMYLIQLDGLHLASPQIYYFRSWHRKFRSQLRSV